MSTFLRAWLRPPRHLMVLFVLVTLVPSILLMASGWRLLQQDREIERQQRDARRDQAADLVVSTLEQGLEATEERLRLEAGLDSLAGTPDSVVVVFTRGEVRVLPEKRVLYLPDTSAGREAPARQLAPGEALEYREQDPARAAAWFRNLAATADPAIRTAALFALARNSRKLGAYEEALDAYGAVASGRGITIAGIPADLLARTARCTILAELNRSADLEREAGELLTMLLARHWDLGRAAFEVNLEQANAWVSEARTPPAADLALASIVEALWIEWRDGGRLPIRKSAAPGGSLFTVLAAGDATRLVTLVAGPDFARDHWTSRLHALETRDGLRISLHDAALQSVPLTPGSTRRSASDSGLPWTLLVQSGAGPAADALTGRRRLWFAGLLILTALVFGGTCVVGRAVTRELEVARLQSDFVAAVSHEFRTPLTSLRQLSEMLLDRPHPPERVRSYYAALQRQTERLHRLVESLLDFGRMEAGTSPYRLEPLDVPALVKGVVAEFRVDAACRNHAVDVDACAAAQTAGDRDALANAVWNLLDNAAKYSPGAERIRVDVAMRAGNVIISVTDEGFGVAPEEQSEIFRKFVRGSRAKAEGITGTGIGLAMVRHIVSAHHGTIDLHSEPGAGTTVSLRLPALPESRAAEGQVWVES